MILYESCHLRQHKLMVSMRIDQEVRVTSCEEKDYKGTAAPAYPPSSPLSVVGSQADFGKYMHLKIAT